jgi:hypothetical protein
LVICYFQFLIQPLISFALPLADGNTAAPQPPQQQSNTHLGQFASAFHFSTGRTLRSAAASQYRERFFPSSGQFAVVLLVLRMLSTFPLADGDTAICSSKPIERVFASSGQFAVVLLVLLMLLMLSTFPLADGDTAICSSKPIETDFPDISLL